MKEDWYRISKQELLDQGAQGILKRYENMHSKALVNIYSDYPNWDVKKFERTDDGMISMPNDF